MRIIIKYKNILIPPNNTPPLDNIPLPSPVGEGLGVRLGVRLCKSVLIVIN